MGREPDLQPLSDFRASLAHLRSLQVARLEQLLTGTLDLCSHRLDAWITSFATKRLAEMRKADPAGVLFGGYGWVMNLTPAAAPTPVAPPPGEPEPVYASANNPGFVHTPSLTQAATAAMLPSGHLTHAGPQRPNDLLAIDLSSERVRLATWLLDGVRQGQPLGALLGYRFERGLHERQLDQFIAVFRRIVPFGELLKARVAWEDAEAEAARLRTLGHPDLADAERALNAARMRHDQLLAEQASLPGRIAEAEAQRLSEEKSAIIERKQRVEDLLRGDLAPPFDLVEEHEALQTLLSSVQDSLTQALARAQADRERIGTIPGVIASAASALQQAEQHANSLRGLPHPDLAAAELAAAARERYQQQLDQYRRDFLFPDTADQRTLESVAADYVVDGLALLKLWEAGNLTFGRNGLPEPGSQHFAALKEDLKALAHAVDAVSDALMAESVYQVVRGNPLRAASTVESLAGGETPPPELEVVRTPRTGIALTHRLVTLFSGAPVLPPGWTPPGYPYRADAEPHVNAWAAKLLGNPANVRCVVERLDPATGNVMGATELRLDQLRLAPLDFIYAVEGGPGGQQGEIEQRLLLYTMTLPSNQGGFPPGSLLRLNPHRQPEWSTTELSYGEFSELLRTARRLITSARGIDAGDVSLPARSVDFSVDTVDLEQRAVDTDRWLHQTTNQCKRILDSPGTHGLGELREVILRSASFGAAGAVPLSAAGNSPADRQTLVTQVGSIQQELAQRVEQLKKLTDDFNARIATVEDRDALRQLARDYALARLRIVFGKAFVVLSRFTAANAAELENALADSAKVQDGDPFAATTWFQRMARVRDGVARLHDALSYAEAIGSGEKLQLTVAQLPYNSDDRWVGLPLTAGQSLPGGKLSLVVQSAAPVDVRQPLAGLLIDEWVEVVPSAKETTGIALQYDQPNAAPPQTILIAVPPEIESPWTVWSLQQVRLETLDLTRIRAVDPDALDEVGHYLPALYFACNTAGETVSTDFTTMARPTGDGIPRDPISGYAVPLTQTDWDRVFAAAGVTPKTVNQSWGLQDLNGNPVATIGSVLTASTGTDALSYHQPVTGWERAAIVFSPDAGQMYMFQPSTIAVGPDPTVESALMFSYARAELSASTRRIMVIAGGSHNAMLLSMTNTGHLRLVCDGTETIGTAAAHSVVRPLFLQYDRTNGMARAYSDQEIIAGTYKPGVANSTRGFGTSNNTGSSGIQATLLAAQFRGANAEWTEAEMRAVMHVLLPVGRTVPW